MSRRTGPIVKKPLDVFDDMMAGYADAAAAGPKASRKYLEKVLAQNKSIPNAVKFFIYDLLCEACAQLEESEQAGEYAATARRYQEDAQTDAERQWREYLPKIRCYEVGISEAMERGAFEEALALCEQAIALGLGRPYESKADSIRRML
jgi:hypothetical protein